MSRGTPPEGKWIKDIIKDRENFTRKFQTKMCDDHSF